MEKQEFKSKWDDLAREIGAEIPPETQQREEAAATAANDTSFEPPIGSSIPAESVRKPLPKRSAADWDSLAGELGLPPVEPAPPAVDTVDEIRPQPSREERPRPRPEERQPRQRRENRNAPVEGHDPPRDRPQTPGRHREPRRPPADVSDQSRREESPQKQSPVSPADSPRDEPPKSSPAVSLWQKIFGSPAEQSAKLTEISTTGEAVEPADEARGTSEIRSLSGEDVTAAPYVEELNRDEQVGLARDEGAPEERGRGRPRRRRRGRGRKSDARHTHDRPATGAGNRSARVESDSEIDDEFDSLESDDELAGSEMPGEDEDVDDDADDMDGEAIDSRSKAAQRSIPSWDDAIGFIVDSNMQSRSQRRPSQRADSRGRSSRARPRGRKKN